MKLFKKGALLLLCGASALLSGCSKTTVSSVFASVNEKGFVIAKFDLEQKDIVKFDVSFGAVFDHKNITWEQARDKHGICYFVLHVFSSASVSYGTSWDETMRILGSNVHIKEEYVVDVSEFSESQVEEKIEKDEYINGGRPYKYFYVNETVSLDAKRFDLKGDTTSLIFTANALDSERKEIEQFGQHSKGNERGISCTYTYSNNKVTFDEKECMSYSYVTV